MSSVAPLPSLFQMPSAQGGLIGDLTAVPAAGAPAGEGAVSFFGLVSAESQQTAAVPPQVAAVAAEAVQTAEVTSAAPELAPERAAGTVDLAALLATTEALDQGGVAAAEPAKLVTVPPALDVALNAPAEALTADVAAQPTQTSPALQALLDLLKAAPAEETASEAGMPAMTPASVPVATAQPVADDLADDAAVDTLKTENDQAVAPEGADPAEVAAAALPLMQPAVMPEAEALPPSADSLAVADEAPAVRAPVTPEIGAASVATAPVAVTPAAGMPVDVDLTEATTAVVGSVLSDVDQTNVPVAPQAMVAPSARDGNEPAETIPAVPMAAQADASAVAVVPDFGDVAFAPVSDSKAGSKAARPVAVTPPSREQVAAPDVVAAPSVDVVVQAPASEAAASQDVSKTAVRPAVDAVVPVVRPAGEMPAVSPEVEAMASAPVPDQSAAPMTKTGAVEEPEAVDAVLPAVVREPVTVADRPAEAASIAAPVVVDALKTMPTVEQVSVTVSAPAPAVSPTEKTPVARPTEAVDETKPAADGVGPAVASAAQPAASDQVVEIAAQAVMAAPAAQIAAPVQSSPVAPVVSDTVAPRRAAPAVAQAPMPSAKVAVARLAVDGDFQAALDTLSDVEVTVAQPQAEKPVVTPVVAAPAQTVSATAAMDMTPVADIAVPVTVAPVVTDLPAVPEETTSTDKAVSASTVVSVQESVSAPLKTVETVPAPAAIPQPSRPTAATPASVDVARQDIVDASSGTEVAAPAAPVAPEAVKASAATQAATPTDVRPTPTAPVQPAADAPTSTPVADPAPSATVAVANASVQGPSDDVDVANTETATAAASASTVAAQVRPSSERRVGNETTSSPVSDSASVSNGAATGTSAFGLAARKTVTGVSNAAKAFVERLRQGTQDTQISDKGSDTGTTNLAGLTGSQQTANAPTAPATAEAGGAASSRAVPVAHVGAEIARHASNGETSFSVRLHPEELGRIDVKLDFGSDGSAKAHLTVERADTLDTLSRDQRQIEQTLRDAGFSTRDGSVSLSLRQDGGGDRPNQGQWNQQQGENRPRYYADTAGNEIDASVSVTADVYRGRRDALVDIKV